jgi:hypothetical protein
MSDAVCQVCGTRMDASTKRRTYCSNACRQRSYRNAATSGPDYRNTGLQQAPVPSSAGLKPYQWPEDQRHDHHGPTPGALQGDATRLSSTLTATRSFLLALIGADQEWRRQHDPDDTRAET